MRLASLLLAVVAVSGCAHNHGPTRTAADVKTWPSIDMRTLDARRSDDRQKPIPSVATSAALKNKGPISARFRLCVGAAGDVAWVEVIQSSGVPRFDTDIYNQIRHWTFAPGSDVCSELGINFESH
jgi:hypothetical protein